MLKTTITCCFIVFLSLVVKAQLSNSLPAYFHNLHVDPSVGNPAMFDLDNKFEGNIHYKSFFGPLSQIKVFNTSAYFVKEKKQRFGIRVQSESEGKYFQRNRANLVYSIKTSLTNEIQVNFASYLGGVFYTYKTSGAFLGGQDQDFDLGFALSLSYKRFRAGVAANQINEPVLVPIIYEFNISRYFEFYGENKFLLGNKWSLVSGLKYRLTQLNKDKVTQLHLRFSPENERFTFGTHYLYDLGFSPFFSYRMPYGQTEKQSFMFNFSFFLEANNNKVSDVFIKNQYEITLRWMLRSDH